MSAPGARSAAPAGAGGRVAGDRRGSRAAESAASLAIVALVFLAFLPALSAGFQEHWDDNFNVTQNPRFRGLGADELAWMATTFRLGHWQPLSWLSLALDHAAWGLDPFGYHLTNVLLHAATAVLCFHAIRALLAAAGAPAARATLPALAGALVFALHPLRVESVAWITERRDVLSAPLLLGALCAWLAWCARGRRRAYALALGLYALSLGAKAWGITFPAVLLVLDAYPLRRTARGAAALVREKLPFLALAAAAAVLALCAQRDAGATRYAEHFTWLQKAAQACFGLCWYVAKTVWPADLAAVVVLDLELDPAAPRFLAGFAGVAAGLAVVLALRRRAPALAVAVAVYAILVAPVLGLTQSGLQLVADRYAYLATLPFAALLAGLLGRVRPGGARVAAYGAAAAVLAALGARTHAYARVWKDSRTLFEHVARVRPDEWFAWHQLGAIEHEAAEARARAGDADGARAGIECARAHYDRAIALEPLAALAYENRGNLRHRTGDLDGALADWTRAIELDDARPIARVNRGALRQSAGDFAGARADLEAAVRLRADDANAWYLLGLARRDLGARAEAAEALDRCLALLEPDSPLRAPAERVRADLR